MSAKQHFRFWSAIICHVFAVGALIYGTARGTGVFGLIEQSYAQGGWYLGCAWLLKSGADLWREDFEQDIG